MGKRSKTGLSLTIQDALRKGRDEERLGKSAYDEVHTKKVVLKNINLNNFSKLPFT